MTQSTPIAVIGGGVIGLTTAVMLRLTGHATVLYAAQHPAWSPGQDRDPRFATLHAAASALPHSVASPHVARWTGISAGFFKTLGFAATAGVRRQTHYEVFEDPAPEDPPYAASVDNFARLSVDLTDVPRRPGAAAIHGWTFDAWFAEAPEYIRFLTELYRHLGGQVRPPPGQAGLADYLALGHKIHINCTGMEAPRFLAGSPFADPIPPKLIRGHYLHAAIAAVPPGGFFSYNYKPTTEIYRTETGLNADVYCYPRSDGWLLGGSRQEGRLDPAGNWIGQETAGETVTFASPGGHKIAVPAPVLRLNGAIVKALTKGAVDLERLAHDRPEVFTAGIGYRFVRDSDTDSIRLETSRAGERFVIHNYGHGGGGYTLSWGCAADVVGHVNAIVGRPEAPAPARDTSSRLATAALLLTDLARAQSLFRSG